MKKTLKILCLIVIVISITACASKNEAKGKNNNNKEQISDKFYKELPLPAKEISHTDKNERDGSRIEYVMYINEYSYKEFYEYIMELEKKGYHYEFVSDSVPAEVNDLYNKTETSWAANNGKIWIRASWRSNDNPNYTSYNFQLIFDNYDYLIPIDVVEDNPANNTEEAGANTPADNVAETEVNTPTDNATETEANS